ncbi:hypothetical protein [Microbacterium sp. NPDC058389]|uniref:hypothetical protein n=1 Tax=Microbacterium sp. NPDC058389 TaxID=3346475 RepID=UPI0036499D56
MNRLAQVAFGVVAVITLATLSACAPSASVTVDHEELATAVQDSSPDIADAIVQDGTDGTARYLFVEIDLVGEELDSATVAATMAVVAEEIPDEYTSVEFVARTADGERIAVEEPLRAAGLDPLMMGRLRASILTDALRGYTAPA